MNEKIDIAARIAALEQRLLVAVVQRDDHARWLARREITCLRNQLPTARAGSPAQAERRMPG